MKTKIEYRQKRSIYTDRMIIRLRNNQTRDLDKASKMFNMTISSIVREAINQWIGQVRADYPDLWQKVN